MNAAKNRIFALFLPLVGGVLLHELLNGLSKVLPVPKSVFHSLLFFICFCFFSILLLRLPAGRAGFRFSGTAVLETVACGAALHFGSLLLTETVNRFVLFFFRPYPRQAWIAAAAFHPVYYLFWGILLYLLCNFTRITRNESVRAVFLHPTALFCYLAMLAAAVLSALLNHYLAAETPRTAAGVFLQADMMGRVSGYERALVMSLWIFLFVSRGGWLPPSQPRPSYEL